MDTSALLISISESNLPIFYYLITTAEDRSVLNDRRFNTEPRSSTDSNIYTEIEVKSKRCTELAYTEICYLL